MTKKPKLTTAQILMQVHLRELGIEAEPEYQFHPRRRFRFDLFFSLGAWAWDHQRFGVELDGGHWTGGHRHKKAIELDYEKSNLAQVNGFRILRFTNEQVESGYAKQWIKENVL